MHCRCKTKRIFIPFLICERTRVKADDSRRIRPFRNLGIMDNNLSVSGNTWNKYLLGSVYLTVHGHGICHPYITRDKFSSDITCTGRIRRLRVSRYRSTRPGCSVIDREPALEDLIVDPPSVYCHWPIPRGLLLLSSVSSILKLISIKICSTMGWGRTSTGVYVDMQAR